MHPFLFIYVLIDGYLCASTDVYISPFLDTLMFLVYGLQCHKEQYVYVVGYVTYVLDSICVFPTLNFQVANFVVSE